MPPGGDGRPRRRRTRVVVVVVSVVLVVGVGIAALGLVGTRLVSDLSGGLDGDMPGTVQDGPVDVPAERRDLVASVAAVGSLTAAPPLVLGFASEGEVVELEVQVGDRVTAGQVLARQDPRMAQLEVDAAQAALAAAEQAAGPDGGSAAGAVVEEARVAADGAAGALDSAREVAAANAVVLQSSVDTAGRQVERHSATEAGALAALRAAQAAQADDASVRAAEAGLSAARTSAATARQAVVSASAAVAVATASGDDRAVAVAEAELAAAQTASEAAVAGVADAQSTVDEAAATVARAAEARAELAAAEAATAAARDALVAARDARTLGLALDAQTVESAESARDQARASLAVLLSGGASDGAGPGTAGPSTDELQVAVGRARLELETARAALDGKTITAPADGTVTALAMGVGGAGANGAVGAGAAAAGDTDGQDAAAADGVPGGGTGDGSPGTITLSTTQQLVAEITVPEADAVRVVEGMPAELKFSALADVVSEGRVLTVVPTEGVGQGDAGIDPFTGQPAATQKTYTVTMTVSQLPEGARGGLTIAARVLVGEEADALVVPSAALQQVEGGGTVVEVVDTSGTGDATEQVEVEVGLRQGGWSQVLSGLDEGAVVRVPATGPGGGELVDGS